MTPFLSDSTAKACLPAFAPSKERLPEAALLISRRNAHSAFLRESSECALPIQTNNSHAACSETFGFCRIPPRATNGYSLICGSHLISSSSPIRAEVSANSSLRPNEQKEMEITLPFGIYNNPDQASFDLIITVVGGTQYKETISFDLVGIPGENYTSNKKINVTPILTEK